MLIDKKIDPRKPWKLRNPDYEKNWVNKNRDKVKGYLRKYRCKSFGITVGQYNEMLFKQGSRCGICRTHQSELKKNLHIDHSHKTGKFRGLLCHNCNVALGLLKDLPYMSLVNLCHYVRFYGFKTSDEQWEQMFGDKKGEQ